MTRSLSPRNYLFFFLILIVAVDKSPEDILRERFAQMEIGLDAFSSLRYVGIQTTHPPTNYKIVQNVLHLEIENTTVRSPRSLEIVYKAIEVSCCSTRRYLRFYCCFFFFHL